MMMMAQALPRLRMNLDFMPSPIEDRPGLLIRDNFQYSDAVLVIPPVLVQCLSCFDGEQTELDLRQLLVDLTGQIDVGQVVDHLRTSLSTAGFLHDDTYEQLREAREKEFADAPLRVPRHAGGAYPEEPEPLRKTLNGYMDGQEPRADGKLIGIAAPHVSPFGGWESYRAAYGALTEEHRDRTFVILGTSHYGAPDRFGLTRKPFLTPYGQARTDLQLVEELASQPAALMEDYCHSVEHSIEFQVVFLQHLFGSDITIVPILCGSYFKSMQRRGLPEDDEQVKRFLGTLGDIAALRGRELLWVLGIDMAHMGPKYGDALEARANEGEMLGVTERDQLRIERINAGDAQGFWELVRENEDDLKWCGSSPLYTFLKAVPQARGTLRRYQQWNIDKDSVVSFAGMTFS